MPTTGFPFFVEYQELEGYHDEFRHGSPQIVRLLEVGWDRREQFAWNMLGYTGYTSGRFLERVLPDAYGKFPNSFGYDTYYAAEMRLVECLGVPDIEPADGSEALRYLDKVPTDPVPPVGQEVFGRARYEVVYRPRTYRLLEDQHTTDELQRYVTRTSQPSVFNYSIPGNTLVWADCPLPSTVRDIPENLTKTEFVRELTYVWRDIPCELDTRLPEGLEKNIAKCTGKTNDTVFDDRYQAEELLCLAPHYDHHFSPHGDLVVDIHYKFLFRRSEPSTGWNTSFRWDNATGQLAPGFYPIVGNDGATKLYPTTSFSRLFRMDEVP